MGYGLQQMHGSSDNQLVSFNLIRGWKIARDGAQRKSSAHSHSTIEAAPTEGKRRISWPPTEEESQSKLLNE